MRSLSSIVAGAALLAALLAGHALAQTPSPCTHAVAACERWITYGTDPARSMVYASYALNQPNSAITRALIMVHGAGRNANHYFETATSAAFLDGALDNTLVIAPHFIARPDTAAEHEVMWPNGRNSWRAGGTSPTNPTLTSFDFVDQIIRVLADKHNFPNLKQVVVTGHSAGGQYTTRYEMANKVDGTVGVSISYVVANPSSYAWPSALRPLPTGDANPTDAYKAALGRSGDSVHTDYTYGAFDASKVPSYNKWPMGLDSLDGYVAGMSAAQLKSNLARRPTTYLVGQVDVLPLGGFDSSPAAMAQGPTRRARGEAFVKFVHDSLGGDHKIIVVSECGHNDRCIFTTDTVFPYIFPE